MRAQLDFARIIALEVYVASWQVRVVGSIDQLYEAYALICSSCQEQCAQVPPFDGPLGQDSVRQHPRGQPLVEVVKALMTEPWVLLS